MMVLSKTLPVDFLALDRLKEVLQKVELVLLVLTKPILREYFRA